MGRRRGAPDRAILFDLVPDDGAEAVDRSALGDVRAGGHDVEPMDASSTLEDARRRWRGMSRKTRLGALVTVGALVVGGVVVDGVLDRSRSDRLRAASGGVTDLSEPLFEVWHVSEQTSVGAPGGFAAVTEGTAVIQSDGELTGYELLTGVPRWTVQLPDRSPVCGPGLTYWGERVEIDATELVTCVGQTASGETTVMTVDPHGVLLSRQVVDGEHDLVAAGPDGGLLTARWVGDPQDVDVVLSGEPMTDLTIEGQIDDGYDLEVSLLDAATGEEQWTQVVEFSAGRDHRQCVRWTLGGRNAEVERRSAVDHMVSARLVRVSGCGTLAWFTPDGHRLQLPDEDAGSEQLTRSVQPLADGGYVVSGGLPGRTLRSAVILDDAGEHLYTVEGRVLDPMSTSGSADGLLLVRYAGRTLALERSGERRWSVDVPAEAVLARTSSVAVVRDARDRVLAIDLAAGDVLWVREDVMRSVTPSSSGPFGAVQHAFTDGSVVALVVPGYTATQVTSQWRAFEAATGRDLWEADITHDGWGAELAVDGYLLRWWPQGVAGFATH